jgi:hypothetical protein
MDWKKLKIHAGHRLFKVHEYMYMAEGNTYKLEINEFADGTFTGHGSHSTDDLNQLKSVSRKTLEECLQALIDSAAKR